MEKNQLIKRLKIAIELLVFIVDAAFLYSLYSLLQITDKPLGVMAGVALVNCIILAGLKMRDHLHGVAERCMKIICRPYIRLEELNAGIWEMFAGPNEAKTQNPGLYHKFSYLPALPLNLVLSAVILFSSWDSGSGILVNMIILWLILTLGGLLSYILVEAIFRATSRIMGRIMPLCTKAMNK